MRAIAIVSASQRFAKPSALARYGPRSNDATVCLFEGYRIISARQ
jgi:hypothetical protein